jgi:hypothetical protein
MPKKVATIAQVFWVRGVGTVIGLPPFEHWSIPQTDQIHRYERIRIKKPTGEHIVTYIQSIEAADDGTQTGRICFSLPRTVFPEHLPPNCELWLEREGSDPVIEPPSMTRFPLTLAQIADHPVVHGLHRILLVAMCVVEGGLFAYMHSVAYAEFSAWLPVSSQNQGGRGTFRVQSRGSGHRVHRFHVGPSVGQKLKPSLPYSESSAFSAVKQTCFAPALISMTAR